jgi:membrane associated rhomboid family serine protease
MLSANAENLKIPQWAPVAKLPFGTLTLVIITIACGIAQTFDSSDRIAELFGFRFISFSQLFEWPLAQIAPTIIQSVTHVFPHGGWWHLIPNTTALFVFGSMAEKRLGTWRLMTLYFVSGVVGIICHAFVPPLPTEPVAGASLAISGLLGAYCALSFNDRVRSLAAQCTLGILEIVAVVSVVAWTLTREVPLQRDRETSILYHLLPLMVMWLLIQGSVAVTKRVHGTANKAVNPSGGSGEF